MENVITPKFRVSYPQVFKPKLNDLNGKQEYSVVAIFPPGTDMAALNAQVAEEAAEKWGPDKAKWPKPLRNPIRKNEEREKEGKLPDGYEAGGVFINFKGSQRPGVVDQNVQTTDAVAFATLNTGQGANELYDMDQNVDTTASPSFVKVTASAGPFTLYSRTKAQLEGTSPTAVGQMYYCSDCSTSKGVVVSTGTSMGPFAAAAISITCWRPMRPRNCVCAA